MDAISSAIFGVPIIKFPRIGGPTSRKISTGTRGRTRQTPAPRSGNNLGNRQTLFARPEGIPRPTKLGGGSQT